MLSSSEISAGSEFALQVDWKIKRRVRRDERDASMVSLPTSELLEDRKKDTRELICVYATSLTIPKLTRSPDSKTSDKGVDIEVKITFLSDNSVSVYKSRTTRTIAPCIHMI